MGHPIRVVIGPAGVHGEGLSEAHLGAGVIGNVARQRHRRSRGPAPVASLHPGAAGRVPDGAVVVERVGEGNATAGLVDDRDLKVDVKIAVVHRIERPPAEAAEGRQASCGLSREGRRQDGENQGRNYNLAVQWLSLLSTGSGSPTAASRSRSPRSSRKCRAAGCAGGISERARASSLRPGPGSRKARRRWARLAGRYWRGGC